jgi:two-component system, NtrC family, response regulator HydG
MMVTHRPRLLIVDDEHDTCDNLSDIFGEFGYQVDVAYDGPSALALVDENVYDLALLDLKMPGMNGLELYREIRRRASGTVAIVVTAYASSDTARGILDAGAWGIVPKPVNFAELQGQVDEALGQPLVLVVDDDQDLCQSLWDLFREQRYRVCVAHDEATARQLLGSRNHQVVLIDLRLPDADGTKVLECVRSANPQAKALIITGFPNEMNESVQTALAVGADAVCYKPFDVEKLLETVKRLAMPS